MLDAWKNAFVLLQKFKEGDTSEDHLTHGAYNVAFPVWADKNSVIWKDDFRVMIGPPP
jgi:hypothetical protein